MSAPVLGFYGKLPSRGDFLRVSLSRALAASWDGWLQSVMPAAEARLGDGWPDAWWNTRPWRFAAAGRGGRPSMTGVWLASADRTGRLFPLLIAGEASVGQEHLDLAEAEGRAAIRGEINPDELTERLRGCSPVGADTVGGGMRWWRRHGGQTTDAFETSDWPQADLFAGMLRP